MTSVVRPCSSSAKERWISRLGRGVEGGGGLVEDQDRRILEKDTGDGEALLLPARELDAALADQGIEPVRQGGDHRVEPGAARGGGDVRLRGAEPAVGDVLADRAAEQEDILLHDADLAP